MTCPAGVTQAAMVCFAFTARPHSLRTGPESVPSASCTSTYGLPWSEVCQIREPSASATNWSTGYVVPTAAVLPSTWWSTSPSVTYSRRGGAPVGSPDTSSTPGGGWSPVSVVWLGVGIWVGGAGSGVAPPPGAG